LVDMRWIKDFRFRFRPNMKKRIPNLKNTKTLAKAETEEFKELLISEVKIFTDWAEIRKNNEEAGFFENFGFELEIKPSNIAGRGVFLKRGRIKQHKLVALYPGTVYYPGEPVFFQSIRNHVMLECLDGVYIDGKHEGLSRSIYKSCEGRLR